MYQIWVKKPTPEVHPKNSWLMDVDGWLFPPSYGTNRFDRSPFLFFMGPSWVPTNRNNFNGIDRDVDGDMRRYDHPRLFDKYVLVVSDYGH